MGVSTPVLTELNPIAQVAVLRFIMGSPLPKVDKVLRTSFEAHCWLWSGMSNGLGVLLCLTGRYGRATPRA